MLTYIEDEFEPFYQKYYANSEYSRNLIYGYYFSWAADQNRMCAEYRTLKKYPVKQTEQ